VLVREKHDSIAVAPNNKVSDETFYLTDARKQTVKWGRGQNADGRKYGLLSLRVVNAIADITETSANQGNLFLDALTLILAEVRGAWP
jgi:hypothetical protein